MSSPNGCGPSGLEKILPNNIFGVSIKEACNQHDLDYQKGGSSTDRKRFDKNFLANMKGKISQKSANKLTKSLRNTIAFLYYKLVRLVGGLYFND